MTDSTRPKLFNFKLPKQIDLSQAGARISVELEASDGPEGSGLEMVYIVLDRFVSGAGEYKHFGLVFGYDAVDGQFIATDIFEDDTPTTAASYFKVGPGIPTGTVGVASIVLIDNAGNFLDYSAEELEALGFNATIELVNSAAPAAPTAALAGSQGGEGSSVRTFEGSSAAGTTVYLAAYADERWHEIGSAVTGADGKWSLQTGALADGVYESVSAWAVDGRGNASAIAKPFAFDVWKDGLEAPRLALPTDAHGVLRVDNPVVTGSAVPYSLVTLYADGKAVGTGRADEAGGWAILADTLASGSHAFTATQTTVAGSTSVASTATQASVAVQAGAGLKFTVASLAANGTPADQAYIQDMLDDAAARLSEFIDADLSIPLAVRVADIGGAIASAGTHWLGIGADGLPLLDGGQLNLHISHPELYVKGDVADPHVYGHEMLHVLGFSDHAEAFNQLVRVGADGVYFVGRNAVALNGGAVRLDAGRSHIHGDSDLMGPSGGDRSNPEFGPGNPWAPFSQLDIAILKDLGWNTKPVLVSADGHSIIAGSGKAGFDQAAGTGGLDTFYIDEKRSDFVGTWHAGKFKLANSSEQTSHTLSGIERIRFLDTAVALDTDGVAGQVYRLYQAVLGRAPDKGGLGFWLNAMDKGVSLSRVADEFAGSAEFQKIYGVAPSSEDIVTKLYANVLHRLPDEGGFNYWNAIIKRDPGLVEEVLVQFSESQENKDQIAAIIGNGFEYIPYA